MTDLDIADATYIKPITPEYIEAIIAEERPDAILPTVGGQTALNAALGVHRLGILEKYSVQLIGSKPESIRMAEDRRRVFRSNKTMQVKIGSTLDEITNDITKNYLLRDDN